MSNLEQIIALVAYDDEMAAYRRGERDTPPVHPDELKKPAEEAWNGDPLPKGLKQPPKWKAWERKKLRKARPMKDGERRCAYSQAKVKKPICRDPDCQAGQCKRLKALGLNDERKPLPRKERPFCNRLTKKGLPCKARVVPGKTKCRVHGGCSNGPTTPEGKAKTAAAMREGFFKHRERIMAQRHAAKAERDAAKETKRSKG